MLHTGPTWLLQHGLANDAHRLLFDHHPDAILVLDAHGQLVEANQATGALLGHQKSEFLQKEASELVAPQDRAHFTERMQQALSGVAQTCACSLWSGEGEGPKVTIAFAPLRVQAEVVGCYAIVHERVKAKMSDEMRYRSLFKYNPDGFCAFDRNGFFVETNPAYERVVGYTFAELSEMTYRDLLFPEDWEFGTQIFQQVLQGELTGKVEMTLKHKDGQRVEVNLTVVPIVVNQEIIGYYSIVKDITEQKQTEELLRKSEKLSVVGQLAAGVAHEIRNPLTALKGFVQLMQAGVAEDKKYLEIMASELNRIELIVSEFLVLAKPQAIRFRLQSIYDILRDVTALIDTQAILNNVQVVTDWEEGLPPIKCDPNQLKQVFINFLKNSIEAMPVGGLIQIQVRRVEQDKLLLRIIDQGCGISEELIAKLGEPFYSTKEKGTGLGLMVSKKIIDLHHGELHIQSALNVGTTIEVILPLPDGGS